MIRIKTVNYFDSFTEIRSIRYQVFELEQGVDPELEFDGQDEFAQHLLAYLDDQPIGTLRIRYLDKNNAKIERLAVLATARGMRIAQQLMECALEAIAQTSIKTIIVNAQIYIQNLYLKLGFEPIGEPFEEAGILHIKMIKTLNSYIPS
ncbi:GNAT family N-acetyltransferase [Planktothrix mougeotii]|uniref:GNAT family N-acetyltransferase n=1 Tax=Planktothrix mougeotii LEGE 06226 TaxID=1828728 RepID=A0ABR9UE08_9CYAN|nr:GNAT family N-acetyltransferase [Planktothrix mougeotii]MBE9144690.1 GNAT family N-acetyltransferase [Planktothrix mougeotii LEGE 06226]